MKYILAIDQSTQGTKAVIVDKAGDVVVRADLPHKQIVNEHGWVSHDLDEIYSNVISVARAAVEKAGIDKSDIEAMGISNQRETAAAWDKSGHPLDLAVVWQCSRAKDITAALSGSADEVRAKTGLRLSPYFPAGKFAWLLRNSGGVRAANPADVRLGTIDSYLVYRLTGGASFKTDYSNASRTQLFNIHTLKWDEGLCSLFGVPREMLPEVADSSGLFGTTDLEGWLAKAIPIYGAAGDSHGALFGEGCRAPGMIKTTYGTGSSIMMNTGDKCIESRHGLVTSLAWGIGGKVQYVLEGNINYTGAVITWLKDSLKLMTSSSESGKMAQAANQEDRTILVPAFSGLSAPYWSDNAAAIFYGMTRTTGRNELVKAGEDSIALQITAVINAMREDSGFDVNEIRVDGGPTHDKYLMQLQSDLANVTVNVSKAEEASALGAAYLAGLGCGYYPDTSVFDKEGSARYTPKMSGEKRAARLAEWEKAVKAAIG